MLGPQARFPYSARHKYTPPDAPLERALALHDALGIARGLVVHANTHGFDNSVDLDAVARSNGRYLAVVRLDASATPAGCEALHAAGARGVRFAFNPQHGGTLDQKVFDHVLGCIQGLGWFDCTSTEPPCQRSSRGLSPFPPSSPRVSILAGSIGTLAKIAQDIAELSSTEIGELAEPTTGGKDASSTLPFKSNPILCARAATDATLVAQLTGVVLQAGRQREERSAEGLLE